tara:strand:- start:5253 stop:7475 length:2223 start_codon:yes stop_codon:yes gene_type:complete
MLSFNSTLTNKLKLRNAQTFWCLKLYYNDESAFVGMSDTHRVDGSDIYYGLITDWGNISQSIEYFDFSSSIANMTVKVVNSQKSFQDGRFSDQLATKNFANRKWELFQCVHGLTFDTAANMIGSGVIAGQTEYNRNELSFILMDYSPRYHKELPTDVVDLSTYANAPEKNLNKPIPMTYGYFHDITDSGTIDSLMTSVYTEAKFPAIITNTWDDSTNYMVSKPDTEDMHTLDTGNVYYHGGGGEFGAFYASNAAVSTSDPSLSTKGAIFYHYPILRNGGNITDKSFSTSTTLTANNSSGTVSFDIPKIPNLGEITYIRAIISYASFSDASIDGSDVFRVQNASATSTNAALEWNPDDAHERVDVSAMFTTAQKDSWDLEGTYQFYLLTSISGNNRNCAIKQIEVEIQFNANQTYLQEFDDMRYSAVPKIVFEKGNAKSVKVMKKVRVTGQQLQPANIDYVYFSGIGRKFPSGITSGRSTGYATSDYITNPIYIIEDIIRTGLGLTTVDATTFDASGNTTDGLITHVFDDAVGDVKFAFSQNKFIDSKEFIEKIGGLCGTYVFLSGDGNFKTKTLKKPADYSAEDQSIDYNDITLDVISLTPANAVRNNITVQYQFNYGMNQTSGTKTASDSTSQGTTVNGIKQTLEYEHDAGMIQDDTTAQNLATYYKDIMKDRKTTIMFDVPSAKYNHLEIGDIINFDNWDANIKLYGASMDSSNNFFMITQTNKRPNGCEFFCIEVSD